MKLSPKLYSKALFSILFLAAFLFSNAKVFADWHMYEQEIGVKPIEVYHSENSHKTYVLCAGDESENPSIWSKDINGNFQKLADIDSDFAPHPLGFHPAYHNNLAFYPSDTSVQVYDLNTGMKVKQYDFNGSVFGCDYRDGKLFVSIRDYPEGGWVADSNFVAVFDVENETVEKTMRVGDNVGCVEVFRGYQGKDWLAILCEGTFGANDSKMFFVDLSEEKYNIVDTLELEGDTGFDIIDGSEIMNRIYAVMNGSHEIVKITSEYRNIESRFPLPTEGYNGPRKGDIYGGGFASPELTISTYSQNVYLLNATTGSIIDSLETPGWSEGIAVSNDFAIYTSMIYKPDYSYEPDNLIITYQSSLSVDEKNAEFGAKLYPNPAIGETKIEAEFSAGVAHVEIEIVNSIGEIVYRNIKSNFAGDIFETSISPSALGLNAGAYIVRLRKGSETKRVKLIVE